MILASYLKTSTLTLAFMVILLSCMNSRRKEVLKNFHYKAFKDSILKTENGVLNDTSNIFDADIFIPGVDSADTLFARIDTLWHQEEAMLEQGGELNKDEHSSPEEKEAVKENLLILDSFLANRNSEAASTCRGNECPLFAEIIKSTQTLYLHIGGEVVDSFPVSTGMKGYETPKLDVRPSGPLFMKYTSRKFPGGNYMGLGNMPYAVFVRGGYAIHGTTPGNFSKLGRKASHGCIRLHPDNAKIFYELVKMAGLENVWVTIRDTLP